jgi:hypothetical protein
MPKPSARLFHTFVPPGQALLELRSSLAGFTCVRCHARHARTKFPPPPIHHAFFEIFIVSEKRRSDGATPEKSSLAACDQGNGFQSLVCTCLPCASPHSEHGILGKRRVKLRSPAVGRTPRGCQPDEQIRPRLSGTLWSAAVRVRGSRAQRRGRSTTQLTSTAGITSFH